MITAVKLITLTVSHTVKTLINNRAILFSPLGCQQVKAHQISEHKCIICAPKQSRSSNVDMEIYNRLKDKNRLFNWCWRFFVCVFFSSVIRSHTLLFSFQHVHVWCVLIFHLSEGDMETAVCVVLALRFRWKAPSALPLGPSLFWTQGALMSHFRGLFQCHVVLWRDGVSFMNGFHHTPGMFLNTPFLENKPYWVEKWCYLSSVYWFCVCALVGKGDYISEQY